MIIKAPVWKTTAVSSSNSHKLILLNTDADLTFSCDSWFENGHTETLW